VLVTRPFFRSLRNPSADQICSECWFFICIAHLEAGGAGFLLCFGALVWEGVQSLSTKKISGASRASVVQILRSALGTSHEWCSRWGAVHKKSSRSVPCESGARWALRGSFAEASRALPCERGARPGKFAGPGALPCESGARRAMRGRSRVGVVHCGEFAGAPVRARCASWKVHGPRGAPVREWCTLGIPWTLSRGSGAQWGVHGRSRASVVRVLESYWWFEGVCACHSPVL